jgi:hypothetical protein
MSWYVFILSQVLTLILLATMMDDILMNRSSIWCMGVSINEQQPQPRGTQQVYYFLAIVVAVPLPLLLLTFDYDGSALVCW